MEQELLRRVAQQYRGEGFDVVVEPQGDQVPSFASKFRLDMIATRGDEKVVVEVKKNRRELARDPEFLKLSEVINAQPGWRLDLIITEGETSVERASLEAEEPSFEQIIGSLDDAEALIEVAPVRFALLAAWPALEAAMRRVCRLANLPGRKSAMELVSILYSNDSLTREQWEKLRDLNKIRSQVVHGFVPKKVDPEMVRYVTSTARELLHDEEIPVPAG